MLNNTSMSGALLLSVVQIRVWWSKLKYTRRLLSVEIELYIEQAVGRLFRPP